MRLYKTKITFEVYMVAKTEDEAQSVARLHAQDELNNLLDSRTLYIQRVYNFNDVKSWDGIINPIWGRQS